MSTTEPVPEALHALRRVDWRFLLPNMAIGRVAVLTAPLADEPDGMLLAGLEQLSDSVHVVADPGRGGERYDIVVAHNPTPTALTVVARSLDDNALAYLELRRDRRASRLGGLARWQSALANADMELISAHWHHPGFDAAEIVPLSAASVRMALARRRGSPLRSLVAGAARRLPGPQAGLARAAPAISLLAGRRRAAEPRRPALLRAGSTANQAGRAVPWLLVTPRFATSRHVILLAGPDARGTGGWVAKTPRVATDVAALRHEADILATLAARIGATSAFPTLLSFHDGPPPVLVETALVGRPLDPLEVRRDPARALRLGLAWVRTVAAPLEATDAARLVTRVRKSLRHLAGAPFAIDSDAIHRAERILRTLEAGQLPTVVEHGDMSHPNLVMHGDGLGLIDWELGSVDGMPLGDLAFFVGYVAFAKERATTPSGHATALRAALASNDSWGMRALGAHADELGLPQQIVGPLVLAAWTRYAAGVGQRLVSNDAAASAQVARFTAAWHEVLEIVERRS